MNLDKLIEKAEILKKISLCRPEEGLIMPSYYAGDEFDEWKAITTRWLRINYKDDQDAIDIITKLDSNVVYKSDFSNIIAKMRAMNTAGLQVIQENLFDTIFIENRMQVFNKLSDYPKVLTQIETLPRLINSVNEQDWKNAIYTCRTILETLADLLYPPTDKVVDGHALGKSNYNNRLLEYIKEQCSSSTYAQLILDDIDNINIGITNIDKRIKNTTSANNKGTHETIDQYTAKRFICHLFILIGDILMLSELKSQVHNINELSFVVVDEWED